MNLRAILVSLAALVLLLPAALLAHDDDEGTGKLGTVKFDNSCDPKVQAQLQRGVAMLHSFWYSAAEQTFRQVLARVPEGGAKAIGALVATRAKEKGITLPQRQRRDSAPKGAEPVQKS